MFLSSPSVDTLVKTCEKNTVAESLTVDCSDINFTLEWPSVQTSPHLVRDLRTGICEVGVFGKSFRRGSGRDLQSRCATGQERQPVYRWT